MKTKALARREAYPPEKSEAPQRKTAVTEQATGAEENWAGRNTPDEISTAGDRARDSDDGHSNPSDGLSFRVLEFSHAVFLRELWN